MPTVWFCCKCQFGPHNVQLYVSCISCGAERCSRCATEDTKTFDSLSTHSHSHPGSCHESSPYPAAVSIHTVRRPSFDSEPMSPTSFTDLPGVRPIGRVGLGLAAPLPTSGSSQHSQQVYSHTYMYICCNCNDGPKVYNVQPVCVVCHHQACSACTHVK
ncbi:hypothetical protein N7468_003478 [Penicillium chermesinum]|uniref:Uncharacterized protein n=1 Tax=Penicillium chermesinum TaxID=63820 RepID=A0A9W9P6Q1_9EURO|nr:uncharacterized protein N7468_003478 [Penicillium chermesinum]KAJ5238859.1 hypothetical protein N7468_003478 [Penicillium chermesinum]KAJ6164495.1 hypothetical protein N7470_003167 [Penicillium chermesinum]